MTDTHDGWLARAGRHSARHPWLVIAVWLLVLVGATLGHRALGATYQDNFTLPSSPAGKGAALLGAHDPGAGGQSGQLVFTVDHGTLGDHRSAVQRAVSSVGRLPHVLGVSDPLTSATTSSNGRIAYATVQFAANPKAYGSSYIDQVDAAVQPARSAGVAVDYGGTLGEAARPSGHDARSELIGIAVALAVLLVGFGSVYGAGIPLLSAIVGAVAGIGVLGMVAAATTFATVSPTLGVMLGLGVGIDYALFLITRHRQQVMDGVDPVEAAARTVGSSGRSVLVAASTVIIAVLGLYASGIGFIGKLGLAASITVAVAALCAVTLVPALLGLAGARIDRLRVRPRPVAEAADEHRGWQRYAERVGAHPWRFLCAGVSFLLILAIPVGSMHIGHVDDGADPPSFTDRRAYDALSAGWGVGRNGPLEVVVDLGPAAHDRSLPQSLRTALQRTADVASVAPVSRSSDGALLTTTVTAKTSPQSTATLQLLRSLQDETLPQALGSSGAKGYVTGSLAGQLDFRNQLTDRLPVIIATVVAAAFVLLLLSFRSPVLALKAGLLNLLSIGAAYGVLVAVFQWGWGGPALGVSGTVPIESYVPMIMFAIVFGLSMDYEVFLLSRVRDVWNRTGDNHRAVAGGLAATARVITCAALIITSVFLAFLLSPVVVVKMLALGLGVSVLVDATVIRLVVVPATMELLGRANWWSPGWFRHLPDLLEPAGEVGVAASRPRSASLSGAARRGRAASRRPE